MNAENGGRARKKGKGCLIAAVVLIAIGILGLIGIMPRPDGTSSPVSSPATSPVTKPPASKNVIEFTNVITKTEFGMTTVNGEAVNTDSRRHSFSLTVSFYDAAGKLLGVAHGVVNDIEAGQTKTWTAIGIDDVSAAATYKVQVDTMIN